MNIDKIKHYIDYYQLQHFRMFTTSSFQTHSLVLLHILSQIDNSIPVYFINTGFHFSETITFKEKITKEFNLNEIDIFSHIPKMHQKDSKGNLLFTSDPDYCCFLNKVQPLENILASHEVWINGVRGDQSQVRKNFQVEEMASFNTIRFHPMLDWTSKMIYDYRKKYNIPEHPLEKQGYLSIGCEPCTAKYLGEDRGGRWFGQSKTECGLNTELIKK